MESNSTTGCIVRNRKDPFQIQCVFSPDPGDKRDFSVYFNSPGGEQELMVSCTHTETYECIVTHEGLNVTKDLITVSETFSKQNGSFVCRNGGPLLEQFPCFYSGNSVNPEVKCGVTNEGSNTFLKPEDFGTNDNNLAVIIGALCGVVIIIQSLVIIFLLLKNCKSEKDREFSKWYASRMMYNKEPLLWGRKRASVSNQDWIYEILKLHIGKPRQADEWNPINRDIKDLYPFLVREWFSGNKNEASDQNQSRIYTPVTRLTERPQTFPTL